MRMYTYSNYIQETKTENTPGSWAGRNELGWDHLTIEVVFIKISNS